MRSRLQVVMAPAQPAPDLKALTEECARDVVPLRRHRLDLGRRVPELDLDDPIALQGGHSPELPLVGEVGRLQPEARCENAIAGRRRPTTLNVAEHRDPTPEAGPLLHLARECIADAALREPNVPELVLLAFVGEPFELVSLRDDDDREVLAPLVPAADVVAGFVDRDRLLRDEDHVGAAGDSTHDRDPTRVPPHDFHGHDAVVRLGRGVQTVDRLGRNEDRGVKPERVVGTAEVVVDCLRNPDDGEAVLLVQPARHPECVLAADRDESVEACALERLDDTFDTFIQLVWIRPGRPENRPAARQDPRDLARPERLELVRDEPAPAVPHADDLVSPLKGPPPDGADDRVQPWTVTATSKDADFHGSILRAVPRPSAEGGNRTHTGLTPHRILSPARLPVPPLRLEQEEYPRDAANPRRLGKTARLPSLTTAVGQEEGGARGQHGGPRAVKSCGYPPLP